MDTYILLVTEDELKTAKSAVQDILGQCDAYQFEPWFAYDTPFTYDNDGAVDLYRVSICCYRCDFDKIIRALGLRVTYIF